jgi:hypothetical protein
MQTFDKIIPPIQKITIIWHEGTGEFDKKEFTTLDNLQKAFNKIYNHHVKDELAGYTKVKIEITFKQIDIQPFSFRIDVSNNRGDYSAKNKSIGSYIEECLKQFYLTTY